MQQHFHKNLIHDIVPRRCDFPLCEKIKELVSSVDGLPLHHEFLERTIAIKDDVIRKIRAIEPDHKSYLHRLSEKCSALLLGTAKVTDRTKRSVLEVMHFEDIASRVEFDYDTNRLLKERVVSCSKSVMSAVKIFCVKNLVAPLREVTFADHMKSIARKLGAGTDGSEMTLRSTVLMASRNLKPIGVFFFVFLGVYLLANAQALVTVSSRYIQTDSFIAPYMQRREAEKQYVKSMSLNDAPEKLLTAQVESDSVKNKKQLAPLGLDVLPDDNRIVISRIGRNIPITQVKDPAVVESGNSNVIEDAVQDALKGGVVLYPGTAKPGQLGNVFITGHSSYYLWAPGAYKDVFALLHQVKLGDEIIVYYSDTPGAQKKYVYKVGDIKEVKPSDVDVLRTTDDHRLTLMTCTPIGTNLRRLIVTAYLKS